MFCGASSGRDPQYEALARSVGTGLAERGIGVVYGGGRIGLMGALADAALAAGGEVIGVIPRRLVDRELAHPEATAMHVVETLHERKAQMSDLSDGFIALPGGLGTLEELAEVASWAQLDLHAKPIGLLGPAPFWAGLLAWLDGSVADGIHLAEPSRAHRARPGSRCVAGPVRCLVATTASSRKAAVDLRLEPALAQPALAQPALAQPALWSRTVPRSPATPRAPPTSGCAVGRSR